MIKVRIGWACDDPHPLKKDAIDAIKVFVGDDWENIPYNVETKFNEEDRWWHSGKFYEIEVNNLQEVVLKSTEPVIFHEPVDGIYYATIWNGYIE